MIIKQVTDKDLDGFNLQYPDQLVSEKKKKSKGYIKSAIDYFWYIGVSQIMKNKETFGRNYDLVKGTLTAEDFYQNVEVPQFCETDLEVLRKKDNSLPSYVQDFSIINSPLSMLKGELSSRPETVIVKSMDDESQAEELEYRTGVLKEYVTSIIANKILLQASQSGAELSEEEIQQMTAKEVEDKLSSYTSHVERWANRVLDSLKLRFNIKEKSEEAFDDLAKVARQFIHIFEDNSSLGFNMEVLNPVQTFYLTAPGKKYISDPLDEINGAHAAGFIQVMELSEIIARYSLTYEEIKHLQELSKENMPFGYTDSNLFSSQVGPDTIKYSTYNRIRLDEKLFIDSYLNENPTTGDPFHYFNSSATVYGNKFSVMQVYWCSKVKMGKLTYLDENDQVTTLTVDENYNSGDYPGELDLVWGYVNQWWKGTRIGPDIYIDVQPFTLLEYCPIIGTIFEPKNLSKVKSYVDMLKPFQAMCNIYMNKLYEKIQQDWGNVVLTSLRTIPVAEDGSHEDAIEQFVDKAKTDALILVDDSPANTKGASGFNQHSVLQASKHEEMLGYYTLYKEIKMEAWALLGITPERMAQVKATTTATGVQTAMAQSYAQTEPLFAQHEYFMNKVYQALLDAAQYVESNKESSTISYITNEFDSGSISIAGENLKLKDLWVFVTSRSEDALNLQNLKQLSQSMLQNGASPYDIMLLQTSKSTKFIQDSFKRISEKAQAMAENEQALKQQELEQRQQQFQQAQELAYQQHLQEQQNENYNKELDRESKERIALISASSRGEVTPPDQDNSGIPDVYENLKLASDRDKIEQDNLRKQQEINLKRQQILNQNQENEKDRQLKREELDVKKQDIEAKKYVARINRNPGEKRK